MKILSWNVNSVRMRFEHIQRVVADYSVDMVALQETKCRVEEFPQDLLQETHPHRVVVGEKGFNGVAILSRYPLEVCAQALSEDHLQARFVHVCVQGMHVINVYVPNGESVGSEKFVYKERFFADLIEYVERMRDQSVLIMGDFNVAPQPRDVYAPQHFAQRLLFSPKERQWMRALLAMPLYDIFHLENRHVPDTERYTWWDYRNMAYFPQKGLRIDLMLATSLAYDRVKGCQTLGMCRQDAKPSDHVPIVCHVSV